MKKENFQSPKENYSKKHKLNTCNKIVPSEWIDGVEKEGITLEKLEALGHPVYFYKTQITIHGIFPEEAEVRVKGYKSIIRNKNKSIGVKYNAIDAGKVSLIQKLISPKFSRNGLTSSSRIFSWRSENIKNQEDYSNQLEVAKKIYSKIDTSLIYGSKEAYVARGFFGTFLVIEVTINAIKKNNVKPFVESFGVDYDEKVSELEAEKINEIIRQQQYEAELAEKRKVLGENRNYVMPFFFQLFENKEYKKPTENGFYIIWSKSHYEPKVVKLEKSGRQKYFRMTSEFVDISSVNSVESLKQKIEETKAKCNGYYFQLKNNNSKFIKL